MESSLSGSKLVVNIATDRQDWAVPGDFDVWEPEQTKPARDSGLREQGWEGAAWQWGVPGLPQASQPVVVVLLAQALVVSVLSYSAELQEAGEVANSYNGSYTM